MKLRFFSVAQPPSDEAARQAVVDAVLSGGEGRWAGIDALVGEAASLFGTSMAAVTLIDRDRQLFLARRGIAAPETSRAASFCAHAILEPERPFCVPDARTDDRFAGNPLVLSGPSIRFYAGVPMLVRGQPIGALCVLDHKPLEEVPPEGLAALERLASQASALIGGLAAPADIAVPLERR